MKNAYETLGLDSNASQEQIEKAYRSYAKILHPDVCKRPTAEQEFKDLTAAYDVLKDDAKRRMHNYELVKKAVEDLPRDQIDDILDDFSIAPVKKKKKKKKKKKSEEQIAIENAHRPYIPPIQMPVAYDDGRGRGEFEGIPPGYGADDSCGGIL